jgi:uncharacterized repeat protein (TIGR03806 family)
MRTYLVALLVVACGARPSDPPAPAPPSRSPPAEAPAPATTCTPGGDGSYTSAPYPTLSAYCMVSLENGAVVPRAGVVAYDVVAPLFSDYADKRRTIWVPPGTSAHYTSGRFDFPTGTIATKSFSFDGRVVETRVLVKSAAAWSPAVYVWNDDHTEATLRVGGETIAVSSTPAYHVPAQTECKRCHEDHETFQPIGLRAAELDFGDQLARWVAAGILTDVPQERAPSLVAWNDPSSGSIEARARSYLDANCSHCHSDGGEARTTGLYLRASETDPFHLGQCKSPVAAGRATADLAYDVVPGAPDESILIHRVLSTEPSVMMPELGRSVVHTEGVELLRGWIAGLSGSCPKP